VDNPAIPAPMMIKDFSITFLPSLSGMLMKNHILFEQNTGMTNNRLSFGIYPGNAAPDAISCVSSILMVTTTFLIASTSLTTKSDPERKVMYGEHKENTIPVISLTKQLQF
jgi:hypothetical protein